MWNREMYRRSKGRPNFFPSPKGGIIGNIIGYVSR